jgi:hypothetical protein
MYATAKEQMIQEVVVDKAVNTAMTKANVLSFAEVEEKYPINYIPCTCLTEHLPAHNICFNCIEKLFAADWDDNRNINATIKERGRERETKCTLSMK